MGAATPPTAYENGNGYYGYNEVKSLMGKNRWVGGLDEVMDWTALHDPKSPGYQRLWECIQATWESRGLVEGHGAGLYSIDQINAFADAGPSSDHSLTQAQESWLKLEHGLFLADLKPDIIPKAVPYFLQQGLKDWTNTSVTTDDRDAATTMKLGCGEL